MELDILLANSDIFERLLDQSSKLYQLVKSFLNARFKAFKLKQIYPQISETVELLTHLSEKALLQLDESDKFMITQGTQTSKHSTITSHLQTDELTETITHQAHEVLVEKINRQNKLLDIVDGQNIATIEYVIKNNNITRQQIETNLYITYPQILATLAQIYVTGRSKKTDFMKLQLLLEDL